VLVAIVDRVQARKLEGSPIDVHATAREVSSMHQQSGMTIDELEQVIAGWATKAGVPVLTVSKAA
jgi:hypothetical protein